MRKYQARTITQARVGGQGGQSVGARTNAKNAKNKKQKNKKQKISKLCNAPQGLKAAIIGPVKTI